MDNNDQENRVGTSQEDRTTTTTQGTGTQVQNKDSARYCWVCFATDEEDRDAQWVQPCNCRGTTKWVCRNMFFKFISGAIQI